MSLDAGLYLVPEGYLAAVVTHLETTAVAVPDSLFPDDVSIEKDVPSVERYRSLFRAIGAPWLWTSRLKLSDADLAEILSHQDVEVWLLRRNGIDIGVVELDFRVAGECELAFFGLIPTETGGGLGKAMMSFAQKRGFSRPIKRFHLHTCTLDSPKAVPFYLASGLRPTRREVEIFEDPRLAGYLGEATAPQHPLINPK